MQFPILIFCQNYERTLKYRSHSYSFIVIIICFFSYKLISRSTFFMNLMWYIFEGVVVSQWSIFLFFWYEVEFLLSCWLRQCWSIWHVNILYCSFLCRKDWLILNQTKCSFTNKIFDEQMYTQAKLL